MSETRELPPSKWQSKAISAVASLGKITEGELLLYLEKHPNRPLHLCVTQQCLLFQCVAELSEALRERDGLQAKLDGIEGQIRRQERLYNLAFDNQVRAYEFADKAERERDEAREALYLAIRELAFVHSAETLQQTLSLNGVEIVTSGIKLLGVKDLSADILTPPTKGAPE